MPPCHCSHAENPDGQGMRTPQMACATLNTPPGTAETLAAWGHPARATDLPGMGRAPAGVAHGAYYPRRGPAGPARPRRATQEGQEQRPAWPPQPSAPTPTPRRGEARPSRVERPVTRPRRLQIGRVHVLGCPTERASRVAEATDLPAASTRHRWRALAWALWPPSTGAPAGGVLHWGAIRDLLPPRAPDGMTQATSRVQPPLREGYDAA